MKGTLSVDPIFMPYPGIKRAKIYHLNPLVALDHFKLYLGKYDSSADLQRRDSILQVPSNVNSSPKPTYFNMAITSIAWPVNRAIINVTYSKQFKVLFLLCDDWKIHVYNQSLEEITKIINWESKYTVGFELLEQIGALLMIGVGEVELLKLSINTNIKQTKFLSSVKFSLQKKKLLREDPKLKLKWNKGYGYDLQEDLLFVWSLQEINFYTLSTMELRSEIRGLLKKQEPITYAYFNRTYRYTVTGLINGAIKVWRLPLSQTAVHRHTASSSAQYILIYTCLHHFKPIDKILAAMDDRVIFSQSGEPMVCMWSLETFELLRIYDFESQYTRVILTDHLSALAVKDNGLVIGQIRFGKTMEFVTELSSASDGGIVRHQKVFQYIIEQQDEKEQSKHMQKFQKLQKQKTQQQSQSQPQLQIPIKHVKELQLTLGSNMGLQIRAKDLTNNKDLNKVQVKHFYPPPKSRQIIQVVPSPYFPEKYYLLTETGKIFKVRMGQQDSSSVIEHCFSIIQALDVENHPLGQLPTLIKFCCKQLKPIEYDSEVVESALVAEQRAALRTSTVRFDQLITIGCDKGSIVFLPVDHMDRIYTRLTYHRDQITAIQTVYDKEIKNCILVSVCAEGYLKMVRFLGSKANCFITIQMHNRVSFIRGFDDRLAIVLKKDGLFQIMSFQEAQKEKNKQNRKNSLNFDEKPSHQQQSEKSYEESLIQSIGQRKAQDELRRVYAIPNYESLDHEGEIVSLDVYHCEQVILTAGSDNRIKLWSYLKVLLYEILLDQGLKYAVFSNNFEVLVQHKQKLLHIRNVPFTICKEELDQINQAFLQGDQQEEKNGEIIQKNNIPIVIKRQIMSIDQFIKYGIDSSGNKKVKQRTNKLLQVNQNENEKEEEVEEEVGGGGNYQSLVIVNMIDNDDQKGNKINSNNINNNINIDKEYEKIIYLKNKKQQQQQIVNGNKAGHTARKGALSQYSNNNNKGNIKYPIINNNNNNNKQSNDSQQQQFYTGREKDKDNDKEKSFVLSGGQQQDWQQNGHHIQVLDKISYVAKQAEGKKQPSRSVSLNTTNATRFKRGKGQNSSFSSYHSRGGGSNLMNANNSMNATMGTRQMKGMSMTKQHIQEVEQLRREVNKPLLPRVPAKGDIFDEFMKDKLLSKKVLTRRDITLNRIIMKNIIKQSLGDRDRQTGGMTSKGIDDFNGLEL